MVNIRGFFGGIMSGTHFAIFPYMAFITAISLAMILIMTLPGLNGVKLDDLYVYRYTSSSSLYYNAYLFNYCRFTVNLGTTVKECSKPDTDFFMDISNLPPVVSPVAPVTPSDAPPVDTPPATPTTFTPPTPGQWIAAPSPTYNSGQWIPGTKKRQLGVPITPSNSNKYYLAQLEKNVLILKSFLIVICVLMFSSLIIAAFLYLNPTNLAGKMYLCIAGVGFGTSSMLWIIGVFVLKGRINSALNSLALRGYSMSYVLTLQSNANQIVSYVFLGCLLLGCVLIFTAAMKAFK